MSKKQELEKLLHDVKSPLTSIIGYSELLLKKEHKSKEGVWIKRLHEDTLRVKDLIQKLSDAVAKTSD